LAFFSDHFRDVINVLVPIYDLDIARLNSIVPFPLVDVPEFGIGRVLDRLDFYPELLMQ